MRKAPPTDQGQNGAFEKTHSKSTASAAFAATRNARRLRNIAELLIRHAATVGARRFAWRTTR